MLRYAEYIELEGDGNGFEDMVERPGWAGLGEN
jgi:hypothetical protein